MKFALLFLLLTGCVDCPPPPRMTCPDGFVLVGVTAERGCCEHTSRCWYKVECIPDPQPPAAAEETTGD